MKQLINLTLTFTVIYFSTNLQSQTLVLDSLFSINGFTTVQTNWTPRPINIFRLNEGKYLVCGFEHVQLYPPPPPIEAYYNSIIRYNNCGTVDSSYGINGQVKFNWPNEERLEWPKSFLLLDDESLLISGFSSISYNQFNSAPLLYKVNSNGMLDTNFITHNFNTYFDTTNSTSGTKGKFTLVEEIEQNKYFCSGSFNELNQSGTLFSRFNSDGSFDSTLNNNGIIKAPISNISLEILSTHRLNAEQLIFTGLNNANMFTSFLTNNVGEIINTYGNDGFFVDSSSLISSIFDRNNISSELKDGKLYVVYKSSFSSPTTINVNRYLSNGFPDSTYGTNGKSIITPPNISVGYSNKLIGFDILNDGRLLIGSLNHFSDYSGASILLNEFGQIDSSFANNGILEIQLANEYGAFSKAIVLPDNRWIVAGSSNGNFLAKYTTSSLVPHISIEQNQLNSNVESEAINYQWFFNGQIITGATNSTLESPQNGQYVLQVEEIEDCGTYSDTITINILENKTTTKKSKLVIQPNPTESVFKIVGEDVIGKYYISDVSGRVIIASELKEPNQLVDISILNAGIYVINLSSGHSFRIVKCK